MESRISSIYGRKSCNSYSARSCSPPNGVWYARRAILSQLWQQGIGRHSQDEVELIGRDTIDAIEALLPSVSNDSTVSFCTVIQIGTSGPFLFGSHPSSFDATLFSFLSGIVESGVESPLKLHALSKPRIMAYVAYINNRYWSQGLMIEQT